MKQDNELPLGWVSCLLGDILKLKNGYAFKSSEYQDEGIPIVRISDINDGIVDINKSKCILQNNDFENYTVDKGDILIAMSGATTGKFGIYNGDKKAYQNQRVGNLKLLSDTQINKKIIYYLLHSLKRKIEEDAYGGAQPNISGSKIEQLKIILPPLNEQHRIVTEIEKQFSRLDETVSALKRIQANLKRYKASVLKSAVEGKLTAAWREQHPALESAEQLLERILKERRAHWEAAELAKMKANGKPPKDNQWKLKYKEPVKPDISVLPELPAGWAWSVLGQSFYVKVGATPSRKEESYWNGDIAWVNSGEIKFCRIKNTKERISELGLKNSSVQINPKGSVLLAMIGEGKTRGQVAVLDIEACNNQNCAAIWVSSTPIKTDFIYYWLYFRYKKTREIGSGNNQPALNKTLVEKIEFPLPPLAEQAQIIAEVEKRLSVAEEVEQQINRNLKRAEHLRQAILKRAFSGKLVPQDPTDKPVGEALASMRNQSRG